MKIEGISEAESTSQSAEIGLKEYNIKQIDIARRVYQSMYDDLSSETASDNKVMKFWVDAGYNETFRKIVRDEGFLNDPKFQGEILNITSEDILHFVDPEHTQD